MIVIMRHLSCIKYYYIVQNLNGIITWYRFMFEIKRISDIKEIKKIYKYAYLSVYRYNNNIIGIPVFEPLVKSRFQGFQNVLQ